MQFLGRPRWPVADTADSPQSMAEDDSRFPGSSQAPSHSALPIPLDRDVRAINQSCYDLDALAGVRPCIW
jgi:hypothetical protein